MRDAGAVVGIACAWAYCQKGFYRGTLLASLGQPEATSILAFCLPLVCCIVALASGAEKADRAAFGTPVPMLLFGTATGALGLAVTLLNPQGSPVLVYAYWAVLGFTCALAMLGWTRWLVACAYNRGLSSTLGFIFAAMLVARLATSPLFGITALYRAEIYSMLPCSCLLWALCGRTAGPVEGVEEKGSASPLRSYIPVIGAFTALGLLESLVLVHNGGAYELGFSSSSREVVLTVFLFVGCACQSRRLLAFLGLDASKAWFLLFGLALGMPVGMLTGTFAGASTMGVALEFSSTVQALIRALLFIMAVLVAYETSASPHLTVGVALFVPLVASFAFGSKLLPGFEWLAGATWCAGVLSALFFAAMVAFIVQVNRSGAFRTMAEKPLAHPSKKANDHEEALAVWRTDTVRSHQLTEREGDVMMALACGKTAKEIGEALFISPQTVYTHAKHIYAKLGIHSKQELVILAQQAGKQ